MVASGIRLRRSLYVRSRLSNHAYLSNDLLTLTQIFIGEILFAGALSKEKIVVDGEVSLTPSIWKWLARSRFVDRSRLRSLKRADRRDRGPAAAAPNRG